MPSTTRRLLLLATLSIAPALAAQRAADPLDSATGRIMFSVGESVADAAGRTRVVLQVRTEKGGRCYASLGARVTTRGDTIVVDRWSLSGGDVCLDEDPDHPSGAIRFPLEEGRRVLAIAHLGAVDRYRLAITGDAIRIAPIGAPRVSVLRDSTLVWRYPRNSLVLRCTTGEHTAWTCAEVFRLAADEPALVPIDFPPAGRNPYRSYQVGEDDGRGEPARYFRVAAPAGYDRFVRGVERLHDAYAGGRVDFNVSIQRWTGASWSLDRQQRGRSP